MKLKAKSMVNKLGPCVGSAGDVAFGIREFEELEEGLPNDGCGDIDEAGLKVQDVVRVLNIGV